MIAGVALLRHLPGDQHAGNDALVAALSFPATVRLTTWHPGVARPDVVALKPGPGAAALVVG